MFRSHLISLVTLVLISCESQVIRELSHEYPGDADEEDETGCDEMRKGCDGRRIRVKRMMLMSRRRKFERIEKGEES